MEEIFEIDVETLDQVVETDIVLVQKLYSTLTGRKSGIVYSNEMELDLVDVKMPVGSTYKLGINPIPFIETLPRVMWDSNDLTKATISEEGVIYAKTPGVVKVVASQVENPNVYVECEVTIDSDEFYLFPPTLELRDGEAEEVYIYNAPEGSNITWVSSDPSVTIVDGKVIKTTTGEVGKEVIISAVTGSVRESIKTESGVDVFTESGILCEVVTGSGPSETASITVTLR